jgi:septation ring formation regulator EzrA
MKKINEQMKELVRCQGNQTREYIEKKMKNFIDVKDFDIDELQKTLDEIKGAIKDDEDTFKLIDGIMSTNKSKITQINLSLDETKGSIKALSDDNVQINRKLKECLRVQEEDMDINVSELCAIFGNALSGPEIDEKL